MFSPPPNPPGKERKGKEGEGSPVKDAALTRESGVKGKFNKFWNAYPNKKGKDAAYRKFEALNPDECLLLTLLGAIENQKRSEDWRKDNGQFIPHPATWLNQGRWKDQPVEVMEDENVLPF